MSHSLREDLDAAMVGVVLGEHRRAAILEAMEKGEKPVKKVIRPMVALAAVIAALTISALAFSPAVQKMLAETLGGFAPYSQEVVGVSATDRGIKVTLESVLSDNETTTAYLSVTDQKGDRLDESTILDSRDQSISYDAESKTALYAVKVPTSNLAPDGTVTLHIDQFQPGHMRLNGLGFPQELLKDRTLSTQTLKKSEIQSGLAEGQTEALVLRPGQTPAALEGTDLISISSAGFDQNGTFHIVYEIADGVTFDHPPMYNTLTFDDDREDVTTMCTNVIYFGSGKYLDQAYVSKSDKLNNWPTFITRESISHLTYTGGYIDLYTKPKIEGKWTLTAPVEVLPSRTATMSESLGRKDFLIEKLTFSMLGVKIEGRTFHDKSATITNFPITVYLKDGSVYTSAHMESGAGSWWNNMDTTGAFTDQWTFDTPIDPREIIGFSFGYWYNPIDGDAAGAGYWLDKLPE